jgi:murein hydrolase activator
MNARTANTIASAWFRGGLRVVLASMAMALSITCTVLRVPVLAQSQAPDEARRKLDANKKVLDQARQREQELQRDVGSLEAERARVNRNLIDTAKAIQRAEAQLTQIENRVGELEAQEKLVRGSLQQNQGRIAKLLAAMQRMGRNPPPVMVTRREDALEMVRSAMLLASVFPEMREQALYLSEKLNQMAAVMAESRKQSDQLKAETARLSDSRTRLDGLMVQKRENINERQGELRQVRQAAAELSRSVTDLNELITKLDKTVSEQAGIAEYDRELAASRGRAEAAAETPANKASGAAQPASPPAKPAEIAQAPQAAPPASAATARDLDARPKAGDRMAEKGGEKAGERGGERLAMLAPKPMKPSTPFDQMKGALALPASGKRVIGYGERTEVGATSKGIVIETRASAQITSPSDGWIVYAGEFRSYGQLLIINAGGGYHMVLAGLTRIDVSVGQFVLAGEPVGAMGTSGPGPETRQSARAAAGKSQDALPVLYVEFRKDGRPFDPTPWWAPEGSRKVQG